MSGHPFQGCSSTGASKLARLVSEPRTRRCESQTPACDVWPKVWTFAVKPAASSNLWFPNFGFPLSHFAPPNAAGPRGLPLLGGMPWTRSALLQGRGIRQQLCFALTSRSTAFIAPAPLLSSPGARPTRRQRRTHVKRHLLLSTAELAAGPACFQARNRRGADTAMASMGDPATSRRL